MSCANIVYFFKSYSFFPKLGCLQQHIWLLYIIGKDESFHLYKEIRLKKKNNFKEITEDVLL